MTEMILRTIEGEWDRMRNMLWWRLKFTNGRDISVGFPLARVALTFHEELSKPDVQEELSACGVIGEVMGDVEIMAPESIDGFLSGITRFIKKATRPIGRAIKRTTRRLKKAAWRAAKTVAKGARYAVKGVRTLAKSKAFGTALGGLSLVMPAVGGPALAAWAVANKVNRHVGQAQRIAKQFRAHPRRALSPSQRRTVLRARQYAMRTQYLARSNAPMHRMMVAGLRSVGRWRI